MARLPGAGAIAAILAALALAGPPAFAAGIEGEWRVVRFASDAAAPAVPVTIEFGSDGRVAGRGGCNRFFGPYRLAGAALSFGDIAATRMACPSPAMEVETRFFDLLRTVTRAIPAANGELRLMAGETVAIVLERPR